jgi:hypothetical protein
MNPKYPVYVISKGRWRHRLTIKALEWMKVPHYVVIEPQEKWCYEIYINQERLLITPFSNLGQGSIPARNFCWEHSIQAGYKSHWILDDNLDGFVRLHNNEKYLLGDGTCFRIIEDFSDRYTNIALSGMQYRWFVDRKAQWAPFYFNRRIYSCILINNSIPYRWRGRYNEDTDLSLRALKDKWCTVLFFQFQCNKAATMTMKGGNTEQLYKKDGRLQMAQSLVDQHPDVTRITWKWGRWQHHVNYGPFRNNTPILKPEISIKSVDNEYGLHLVDYKTLKH